jgi:flagellar hook-associated protein 2
MAQNFSFGGLASGLNSGAIIDALMNVERLPIVRLQSQKARLNQQNDIFGKLDGKLDALNSVLQKMDTTNELASFTATSSDETKVKVTAGGNTTSGAWTVNVTQLAQAMSRSTSGFADTNSTNVGTGRFDITSNGQTWNIDLSANATNTLEDIRDAINNSSAPVSATLINDGTGVKPWRLVVTADSSGAANAVTFDLTNFTVADPAFNLDQAGSILQQAQDAILSINGLSLTRSTNKISDAITGLTLDLQATGTSSITASADNAGVKKKVKEFVDAWNAIVDITAPQGVVSSSGQSSAVLFGDSGLRGMSSRLRSALNTVAGGTSNYKTLSAIGIRTGTDGKLSLDESDFDAALSADFAGVLNVFTDSSSGAAESLKTAVDDLTDPVDGLIESRRDGIASRIKTIDSRINDLEKRMEKFEERLTAKYAALEKLVSSFQAQGSALQGFGR